MPFNSNNNEDDNDLFETVNKMADRMGLKGKERATYVDDHMIQGGYTRVQTRESYARIKNNEEEGGGGTSRWGFGGGRQRSDSEDTF